MSENSLVSFFEKQTITSLELLEQINFFRAKEGKKKPLRHDNLLSVIRDEFDEEIRDLKIQVSFYKRETGNGTVKEYPMYNLAISQAKQVLLRESKFVRKSVIHRLEELEQKEQLRLMEVPRYIAELKSEIQSLREEHEIIKKLYDKRLPVLINREVKKRETAKKKADIKALKKRIVEIVDNKGNRKTAWDKLYKEFEKKYNIDLEKEFFKCVGAYNRSNLTKIDFVTFKLKMINELYEIAKTL